MVENEARAGAAVEDIPVVLTSVPGSERRIKAIYFFLPDPFPEVEEFINECVER